jgi:GT2 family glycosyltransferase
LQQDGLPPAPTLTAAGLATPSQPRCEAQRAAVLAAAPFVSVVIATHNRTESLRATLHSLLALEYPHYNIIVVDNAPSNNATAQMIRQEFAHEARIRYIYEAQAGLAVAHNRGLQEVTAPIVAFTDDDVLVDRHWLTEIVRSFRSAERVGCVTGMIIPAELETPAQGWIEQFGFSKGFEQRIFDMEEHRPPSPLHPYTAGAFGSGANMAFDTQILHAVGGFDPALGAGSLAMGGDDLASFFQIVASGYRLIYQPAAFVRHWHRRDYAGLRRQAYGYGVGLTAYLTKTLVDRPTRLLDFARHAPRGLQYAFKLRSPQSVPDPHGYPRELTTLEHQGMLYGPIAYLRSRHKVRRTDQRVLTSTR